MELPVEKLRHKIIDQLKLNRRLVYVTSRVGKVDANSSFPCGRIKPLGAGSCSATT